MHQRKIVRPGFVCSLTILAAAFALRETTGSSSISYHPDSSSANAVDFPNCNGTTAYIGDGNCDRVNNNVVRMIYVRIYV